MSSELVSAEVARITRLVDDLLLLARSEQTEFLRAEQVALEPFVTELWDGFSVLDADRRFELGPVPAGSLRTDPDRLAQALRNLVRNAIEHTGPGGRVLLHVERAGPRSVRFVVAGRRARHPRRAARGASSSASTAPMPRATAPRAAPGSGSRS